MSERGGDGPLRALFGVTIAGRLLRWFLTLSVLPVVVVLLITDWMSGDAVRRMRLESLAAIAEQKCDRLHDHARERIRTVRALGVSPGVNDALRRLTERDRSVATLADLAFLESLASAYRSPDVMMIGPDLQILCSTADPLRAGQSLRDGRWRDGPLARAVDRARMLMHPDVSEPMEPDSGGPVTIYAVGPVIENRAVRGYLALQLDPRELEAIVLDETGLGASGMTLCAAVIGGELVLTTPTRFDPQAAFRARVPMGGRRLARLQEAARGMDFVGASLDLEGRPVLGAWTHVPALRWGLATIMSQEEALSLAARQRTVTMIIAGIGAVPAAFIAWSVARSLSRPLVRAVRASERLAEGDLASVIEPIGRGEPRRLLESMRSAVRSLAALLGRLRAGARELDRTAAEIRRTAKDQEEVAQGFGASATQVAAAVTEMTGTGRELAGTMSVVAEAAGNAAAAAGRGREGLAELDARARSLRDATDGVARRLATIRERATAINAVVTTITRVADRTNLLSINAALEAEKAGRSGVGFQVVAREINRLSEQTAEATTDIERIVAEMQESVAEGVDEMGRFSRVMEESAATSSQIAGRLSEVISLVEDLQRRFRSVAEGVEAQSIGTRQIAEAMTQLSDGARRTIAAVQAFVAASEQLERSAKSLDADVARFKLPEG